MSVRHTGKITGNIFEEDVISGINAQGGSKLGVIRAPQEGQSD